MTHKPRNRDTAPLFIDVTTRNADDPDQPPRHDRINYGSDRARKWLITHTYWAMYNGHTVHCAPVQQIGN